MNRYDLMEALNQVDEAQLEAAERFFESGKEPNMNEITKETRRESYDAILPKVKERARLVLETLGGRSMTVSEITEELVSAGKIPYFNRNYVAPRLTELKDMGIVETCGRRKATRSDATEAVWRRVEVRA